MTLEYCCSWVSRLSTAGARAPSGWIQCLFYSGTRFTPSEAKNLWDFPSNPLANWIEKYRSFWICYAEYPWVREGKTVVCISKIPSTLCIFLQYHGNVFWNSSTISKQFHDTSTISESGDSQYDSAYHFHICLLASQSLSICRWIIRHTTGYYLPPFSVIL